MTNSSSIFSLPKRDFLHSKLDDIINLWARRSGQGTFYLSVIDGVPNFQCGLQLDFSDVSVPEHSPQLAQHHQHQLHQGPRRRGAGRQTRNRERAAKFQAAKAAATAASAKPNHTFPGHAVKASADVILPFSGRLLPVVSTAPSPSPAPTTSDVTAPVSTPSPAAPASRAAPTQTYKSTSATPSTDIDMSANKVKRDLFPSDKPQIPQPNPAPSKPEFKRREEQLWTKLFE